ncbi:hypothetical protein PCANC_20539 [Puccinia coronata f. sp. avenae]|uniref:Uncharacterized protein n=1 Tax=Puccinia coronata f. sp. avenae TaxID=200324 RepID=A0A2N5U5L0_9BASI|nr:hypothetical protein PCANC_20539 [Puccinia coronata f. sp. avenae]
MLPLPHLAGEALHNKPNSWVQAQPLAGASRPLDGATNKTSAEGTKPAPSLSIQSLISTPIVSLAACISPRTKEAINTAQQLCPARLSSQASHHPVILCALANTTTICFLYHLITRLSFFSLSHLTFLAYQLLSISLPAA